MLGHTRCERECCDGGERDGHEWANLEPFHDAPAPDRAIHVAMSDGVRIAVNLYFPPGFDVGSRTAPTAYIETWYTRGREAGGEAIDL